MINRRNFLNRTVGTGVVASTIYGVERAAAAEPSSGPPALAADRSNAVPPSVHADLKRHGMIFERKIHQSAAMSIRRLALRTATLSWWSATMA